MESRVVLCPACGEQMTPALMLDVYVCPACSKQVLAMAVEDTQGVAR